MKFTHVALCALPFVSIPFSAFSMSCDNQGETLSLWQNSSPRSSLLAFVDKVTNVNSTDYVPANERIAVIDNDGTLWPEKPMYTQFQFAFDQIKAKAKTNLDWGEKTPYKWVVDGDIQEVFKHSWSALLPILAQSQSGVTPSQYSSEVLSWLKTHKSSRFNRPYTSLVYQPMIQVIDYLKANQFDVYIVTGAGAAFVRPWSEAIYHIPAQNVIGTTFGYSYKQVNGKAQLVKNDKLIYVNDGPQKAINIETIIGKRPIVAIGNSTGDAAMLDWTTSQKGESFAMLIHHTDQEREWSYGPSSFEGKFTPELMNQAKTHGWNVVNMKNDWCQIFPTEKEERKLP
ncbi:HAD family hydrolase [Photobacterium damselae]|uniref:HAD family hydrolase n=1 Tax=Photobacterium damselae TaxID=38293 RepID=UPI001F1EB31E|nr:HAD family hydrolase [Photobacterium damselae]UKA03134.1 haloacid dehalogenase-like hydrolase [Photobacterium damselae subsp. damselae]